MSSLLTNSGAITALQTLNTINKNLTQTQNEISTGKRISDVRDNPALWAISRTMEADMSAFRAVQDNLSFGEAVVNVAKNAADQIVEKLREIRDLTLQAQTDGADFEAVEAAIDEKENVITALRESAQFNGVNLLNTNPTGGTPTQLTIVGAINRVGAGAATDSTFTIDSLDFEADILAGANTIQDIGTVANAADAFDDVEALLNTAIDGAATLGSAAERIADQKAFVDRQFDVLKVGVGALVDADMEEASARLQALQVQQQLGVQALSIANQAPQTILSLFR
jgi:flagellin